MILDDKKRIVIVGCGMVGSSIAFTLMQSGICEEIILVDVNRERAIGEAMDISHGIPFSSSQIVRAGDYSDVEEADIVIIAAGRGQIEGESRLDLASTNARIVEDIVTIVALNFFKGVLLIVTNPVDVLTYIAADVMSEIRPGYSKSHVIGSGTVLDTARLKNILGERLGISPRNVHAFVLGEHGESEFIAWNGANISGIEFDVFCHDLPTDPCDGYCERCHEAKEKILCEVRDSAKEIIARKKATYYGVAMAVRRICEVILRDERLVLPVSTVLHGEFGQVNVALSMPCVIGRNGLLAYLPIALSEKERLSLNTSARQIREVIEGVKMYDDK